jgi:hypothetical protein
VLRGDVEISGVSAETTNKMKPCNIIHHSTVHQRLNTFRRARRPSSGAPSASGVSIRKFNFNVCIYIYVQIHLKMFPEFQFERKISDLEKIWKVFIAVPSWNRDS